MADKHIKSRHCDISAMMIEMKFCSLHIVRYVHTATFIVRFAKKTDFWLCYANFCLPHTVCTLCHLYNTATASLYELAASFLCTVPFNAPPPMMEITENICSMFPTRRERTDTERLSRMSPQHRISIARYAVSQMCIVR